jgi:hypothetical protein
MKDEYFKILIKTVRHQSCNSAFQEDCCNVFLTYISRMMVRGHAADLRAGAGSIIIVR